MEGNMQPILNAEGISRVFTSGRDSVYALKNLSLTIEQGRLTMLKGRSGSGKTTLLNLFGALDIPTKGKIEFGGRKLTSLTDKQRDEIRRVEMGFVFQSVALISLMSAYENVEFGLRIAGYAPKLREKRAKECLDMVGLGKRMHHRPDELSGGEQQRVAIARAIAHKPKIVFADEPTAELDTHMGLQVVKLFKDLVAAEGITILMSTHDPGMMEIADKVFTLEDGEITDDR